MITKKLARRAKQIQKKAYENFGHQYDKDGNEINKFHYCDCLKQAIEEEKMANPHFKDTEEGENLVLNIPFEKNAEIKSQVIEYLKEKGVIKGYNEYSKYYFFDFNKRINRHYKKWYWIHNSDVEMPEFLYTYCLKVQQEKERIQKEEENKKYAPFHKAVDLEKEGTLESLKEALKIRQDMLAKEGDPDSQQSQGYRIRIIKDKILKLENPVAYEELQERIKAESEAREQGYKRQQQERADKIKAKLMKKEEILLDSLSDIENSIANNKAIDFVFKYYNESVQYLEDEAKEELKRDTENQDFSIEYGDLEPHRAQDLELKVYTFKEKVSKTLWQCRFENMEITMNCTEEDNSPDYVKPLYRLLGDEIGGMEKIKAEYSILFNELCQKINQKIKES